MTPIILLAILPAYGLGAGATGALCYRYRVGVKEYNHSDDWWFDAKVMSALWPVVLPALVAFLVMSKQYRDDLRAAKTKRRELQLDRELRIAHAELALLKADEILGRNS